jgi:tetratricopeptide (TPR) repeat protein
LENWCLVGTAVLIMSVCASVVVQELMPSPAPQAKALSWRDVRLSRQQADLPKALRQADELLAKNPRDDDGLYRKGEILLMMGDRNGARVCFEQAYKIFPIDGYKRAVDAMKVLETKVKTLPQGAM